MRRDIGRFFGLVDSQNPRLRVLFGVEVCVGVPVFVGVDVTVGMSRARDRGELDRIEQETMDFFERVRASYLEIAERSSGRVHVVDASQSLDDVQAQLLKLGRELLSCWKVRHPQK